jgi:predicted HicB family RNase H-like nuclease
MKHKDYIGHVTFDEESEIFHGEVINTRDVITFQGATVKEIKKAFVDSVEDYLTFCKKRGESPDKPFSGKFNVRISPDLHKKVFIIARSQHQSLNSWVIKAIERSLSNHKEQQ